MAIELTVDLLSPLIPSTALVTSTKGSLLHLVSLSGFELVLLLLGLKFLLGEEDVEHFELLKWFECGFGGGGGEEDDIKVNFKKSWEL